jgi:hypothetical protein
VIGHGRRLAVERHDRDDAAALEHGEPLARLEPREDVAGKQRHVDLLLPILPPAPAPHRREERGDVLLIELSADDVFVPAAGPDGVPAPASSP